MPMKSYPDSTPPPDGTPAAAAPASSSPAAATPPAAPVLNPALAALIAQVEATRFDPAHPPPEEPWVFKLVDVEVAHPGNLVTIAAAVKSGKSSVLAAMLASLFGTADGDYLSFTGRNPDGKAVLHFDTEQSRGDHHTMMMRALHRAGIAAPPAWFRSYSLTQIDPADRRSVVRVMARQAHAAGGLQAIFIDGVADLAVDVNDTAEACGLVAELHQLAGETACLIVNVLHHNPGSEKTRGHLGSQIERKSESVLVLRKDGETVSISCQPARRAEVAGDKAPCFTWSDEAGMHISTRSKAASKDDLKREELAELAEAAFGDKKLLRWADLNEGIMAARKCVTSTASEKMREMKRLDVIRHAGAGTYALQRP